MMAFSKVLLPAPLAPMMVTSDPASAFTDTEFSTCVRP